VRVVQPRFPWEVPVDSDAFVGGALAVARPTSLVSIALRLNGLTDEVVAERYLSLRALVWSRAGDDATLLEHLRELEACPAETSWTRWQTRLFRCGVLDDTDVIDAARAVWESLGSNEYVLHLRERPRTYRGFTEQRNWFTAGIVGCAALALGAVTLDDRSGIPWWVWLPVIAAWPCLLWRWFRRSHRRRERIGGKELPHF